MKITLQGIKNEREMLMGCHIGFTNEFFFKNMYLGLSNFLTSLSHEFYWWVE